ncbi:hypothetical protein EIP86_005041 [Pleurotus ostreatoroseus]|nr:hypothetical protein EIP86_005041 [Pleurotus ostreatoroseus]
MDTSILTGSKNKPRIFLAYYKRSARPGDERFHVAIIVRNHPIQNNTISSVRLHAINKVQPPTAEDPVARQVWEFEAKKSHFVTEKLVGLVYLGKLPKGKSIDDVTKICATVPVAPAGESEWRCTNWVWHALKKLEEETIIPPLPCSSEELHRKGRDHILERRRENRDDLVCVDTKIELYDYTN